MSKNKTIITSYGFKFIIQDDNNLLTEEIIEMLMKYNTTIYHNDLESYYWIFDFQLNNVWFESLNINLCTNIMILKAFV